MSKLYFPDLLMGTAALAIFAWVPSRGLAADFYIQEQPATCYTVFAALPVPPYFSRNGCIVNVITVHRLPKRRAGGRTYRSNLAFDLTQQAYVTDSVVQITVVSPSRPTMRD
jgi:hypothetical protein